MSIEIFMPALSPTMEIGTLAKWLVKEGDKISRGDIIAEIETDKATMELESNDEGTLARILIDPGTEDIPVGQIIALLSEEGENIVDMDVVVKEPPQVGNPASTKTTITTPSTRTSPVTNTVNRLKASPLAKRFAKQAGVNIADISGTGPQGRIIKRDVEAIITAPVNTPLPAPQQIAPTEQIPQTDIPFTQEKLSSMRKIIASRLTLSKTTVPHFYLTINCEIDILLEQRKLLNKTLAGQGGKLSVNDFVIRAAGLALRQVPAANVQYAGDEIYYFERADIAVAVAIDGGLITPVIRSACAKGLGQISNDMKDLASRARAGTLMPEDYTGGTFSISNLGMFGINEFSAIINPPQAAILAIGAGEKRPVVNQKGSIVTATVMNCTLSCDHRAIDGAVAAEFLAAFKVYLENPMAMLL
ncbi:MAG: pyruvate dehydrogenase complex dihydrolipoamide acetyltransferase [Robiginitomaculum sp.]